MRKYFLARDQELKPSYAMALTSTHLFLLLFCLRMLVLGKLRADFAVVLEAVPEELLAFNTATTT